MLQGYNIFFEFMEVLGKKWIVPLMIFLFVYKGTTFSSLKKNLKLTSRALSKKLKLLEAFGLVEKIVIGNHKKIVYSLSNKGEHISKFLVNFELNLR